MKSFISHAAIVAVLAVPGISFSQSNEPATRAEVRAELVQLEAVGYRPGIANPHYPADIQAAEATVQARAGDASGYGGTAATITESGAAVRPLSAGSSRSIYAGH